MAERCDACGTEVQVAGGVANIWDVTPRQTGGLTLELADGSEFFLCFDCIDRLPDDPSRDDVKGLR